MVLIGIDLGTTGCRSIVFSQDLTILGDAYIEYPLIFLSPDEIEQDANLWWDLTCRVIRESVAKSGVSPADIKGISVSSQGISIVPVDKDCTPLRNSINWLDNRAKEQKIRLVEKVSEKEIFDITSNMPGAGSDICKILWLREHEPEILEKTHKILTAHDFLVAKLCGEFVTDHTMAGGTLLYDIKNGVWSQKILDLIGLDVSMLPVIRRGGTPAGTLRREVAADLGLDPSTVVSLGGQDQKCAALGAGIHPGVITISLGTAAAITQQSEKPILDESIGIPCYPYLADRTWVFEGCVNTASSSLKWLRDTLFRDKSYKELDVMVESCYGNVNNVFFYPYLSGMGTPHADRDVRGFFYGLSLATKEEEIVKAVLEGVAYQIRNNVDTIERVNRPAEEIRLFGGGSKSAIWCQMISNITGKKVATLYSPETAGIGAAILAGIGAGAYKNFEEATRQVRCAKIYEPDPSKTAMHAAVYSQYRSIEKIMTQIGH